MDVLAELLERVKGLEASKAEQSANMAQAQQQIGMLGDQIRFGKQIVDQSRPAGHLTFTIKYIPIFLYSNYHEILEEAAFEIVRYFEDEKIQECFTTFPVDKICQDDKPWRLDDSGRNLKERFSNFVQTYHTKTAVERMYTNKMRPKVMAEIRFGKIFLVAVANLPSKYFWRHEAWENMSKQIRLSQSADYYNHEVKLIDIKDSLEEKEPDYIGIALEEAIHKFKGKIKAKWLEDVKTEKTPIKDIDTPKVKQYDI